MIKNKVLVFDIETIPDVDAIIQFYQLPSHTSDEDAILHAQQEHLTRKGTDFLDTIYHKIVSISCLMRYTRQGVPTLRVSTLAMNQNYDEKQSLTDFFKLIDDYIPQLVSWNGSGFDLPVMNLRALKYGITASRFWDTGNDFKWNNYISRYHERHCDVMDCIALYGIARSSLDKVSKLCGFAGKIGDMDGSKVLETYQQGNIQQIAHYCETDVANTYLVYLRFLLLKGELDLNTYEQEITLFKEYISGLQGQHWQDFLNACRFES